MENLNDIIASLTPDDIQALKETAQSIFGNDNDSSAKSFNNERKDSSSFGFDFSSMPDPDMFSKIGRISNEAIFYLMSRGISEEEARSMIVSGFANPVSKELPLEYAVEMNNLIRLEMKGGL